MRVVSAALPIGAALVLQSPARADEPRDEPHAEALHAQGDHEPVPAWGLHSGNTVPLRDVLAYGEVGWPDVTLGFQRGMSSFVDLGFRVSMSYAVDYLIPRNRGFGVNDMAFGVGFSAPIRLTLVRSAKVSVLVHADPGFKFDYLVPKPFFGPQIPVGVDLGVHLSDKTTITLGVDVPFYVRVVPDPTGLVPFLAGVTFERRFTDRFGMSLNARPGILYGWNRTGSASDLAFLGQLGLFGRI